MRDDEDSDNEDMPTLLERTHEDIDSSDDEEEDNKIPVRAPIFRKKTTLFKDSVTNNL